MRLDTSIRRWVGPRAVALVLACWGCDSGHGALPDYLTGTWRTSASQYAGSSIQFMSDHIVLEGEHGLRMTGRIIRFEQITEPATTYYRLSYRDAEKQDYQLSFLYEPADGGTVRLKNQPQLIWTKTGAKR